MVGGGLSFPASAAALPPEDFVHIVDMICALQPISALNAARVLLSFVYQNLRSERGKLPPEKWKGQRWPTQG